MKITITKPHLLAALKLKAKNDARYYLNGIHFDKSGQLVSTDGHRMFVGKFDGKIKNSVTLEIQGFIPTRFEYAEIDITNKPNAEGVISFYSCSKYATKTHIAIVKVIDGRYPDYRKVIKPFENKTGQAQFKLNGDYINDVFSIAKHFGKFKGIVVHVPSQQGEAIRFDFAGDAFCIVMPIRMN